MMRLETVRSMLVSNGVTSFIGTSQSVTPRTRMVVGFLPVQES
jgi:hypothetical protein